MGMPKGSIIKDIRVNWTVRISLYSGQQCIYCGFDLGGLFILVVDLGGCRKFLSVKYCILMSLPARRYASAGLCDSDVSVCPSVRRAPVLCLGERKQDHEMYTI